MQELTGKRVLVTGGARRVGAAISARFAAAGANIIIHCRHSRDEAEALASALPGSGHRVVAADFADPAAVEALIASLPEAPDYLINNASCYAREETSAFRALCPQVNVLAPVRLIRAFAARGCGAAVNLLDQAVLRPVAPDETAYLRSRRELTRATETLALELAPDCRVNGVAPGAVLPPAWLPESTMAKTIPTLPLRRAVSLEDLAEAVFFVAVNRSLTGAVLPVDCGQHLIS